MCFQPAVSCGLEAGGPASGGLGLAQRKIGRACEPAKRRDEPFAAAENLILVPNPSYIGARLDLISMLPGLEAGSRVLEVGCAEGATGAVIKAQQPGCHVVGIELDETMACVARARLDEVLRGDAEARLEELAHDRAEFDVVLCGDVLEHLLDPWRALAMIRRLCPQGWVVVSLPNVAHYSTLTSLLFRSRWPYRERGVHDRTHLRWFGSANLPELFGGAGFVEVARRSHHRVIERPHPLNESLRPFVSRIPVVRRLTEYQFLSLLQPV